MVSNRLITAAIIFMALLWHRKSETWWQRPRKSVKLSRHLSNWASFCYRFPFTPYRDVSLGHERRRQNADGPERLRAAAIHHAWQQLDANERRQEQQRPEDVDAQRHGGGARGSQITQHEPHEGLGHVRHPIDDTVAARPPLRHWWVPEILKTFE